jgi:capsular exopolysaccharide synthesis family protein
MLNQRTQPALNDAIPDVREIVMTVWRHRALIFTIMAVTIAVGTVLILSRPKMYRASATVMLEDSNIDLKDFKDVTAGAAFDDSTVQTEIKILTSPALALQTIQSTGLTQNPEFEGDTRAATAQFLKNLSVSAQGTSRVLEVSFKSRDPQLAAKIANAHVDAYFNAQIEQKRERVEKLSAWFEDKVKSLKSDVTEKSQAVEQFRAQEGLTGSKDVKDLISQQMADTAAQLVPVEVRQYDAESKLEGAKSGNMTDVVNSPLIQTLKAQAATAAQNVQSMRASYGPKHPKLVAAENELKQVNRAIASETANIRNSIKNDAASTQAQATLLQDRIDALKTQSDAMREKSITLTALELELDASQKMLDSFLANYQTIQSQVNFARPDAVLVSEATAPLRSVPPGKTLLMLALIVFAGCLALGTVFAIEMMRGGLRNFDDVRKMGQRPIGVLPKVANPSVAVMNESKPTYREAIKRIYMASMMNGSARTVLVTSAMPDEGRTTFTVSMAYYLMSLGHKVLVIDADTLRPALSRLAGVNAGAGFADVLAGRARAEEAINTDDNGLAIMQSGGKAFSPDLLQSARLKTVMDELKNRYEYILVDSSPLLAHSEAAAMARQVDGIIVVAEWMKTSQKNIANMFASLSGFSAPVLGVIINKVDIGKYKSMSSDTDFLLPKAA